MIEHYRNILNYDDRYAFALLKFIRKILVYISNHTIKTQIFFLKRKLKKDTSRIKYNLKIMLPEVTFNDLKQVITNKDENQIIDSANSALNKTFFILSKKIKFDKDINWHLDFNSDYEWPKGKLYNRYEQVNIFNEADVKFPRELSRGHHFLYLGQAYILTKDEKYVKEFKNQVLNWISENPYKKSINWGCSMDIAIRVVNWIYALRMVLDSPNIDMDFLRKIELSLFLHGRYIFENPEKGRINNHNHYLSDLAGQILLGFLFSNSESKQWKNQGVYELFKEIRLQILPTGPTYERSTNYHRLVTEIISYTLILLKKNNYSIPIDINYRVKSMFDFILAYNDNLDSAPIIGDQDNGRYLPFVMHEINNHKYLYSTGAILFKDTVLKYYSHENDISNLFLFGAQALQEFNSIKIVESNLKSRSFSDAGFYKFRSENIYMFINNSGLSHYNEIKCGTHTHSDLLSFVYYYKNYPLLVDPGTYVYSSNPKERMKFRSTYMHNTLTVNELNQNDLREEDLWFIQRDAIPIEKKWFVSNKKLFFSGSHTGYLRLEKPFYCTREFQLDKITEELTIRDIVEGKGKYLANIHFHFDDKVKVKLIGKKILCELNREVFSLTFNTSFNYKISLKEEYISKSYNKKVKAPYIIVSIIGKDSLEFYSKLKRNK